MSDDDLSDPEVAGRILKDDADRILGKLSHLRAIEEQKRQETPTTPEYHELSERATDTAREVFRATMKEDVDRKRVDDAEEAGDDQRKPPSAQELERRERA
jgi:hypothetical protein